MKSESLRGNISFHHTIRAEIVCGNGRDFQVQSWAGTLITILEVNESAQLLNLLISYSKQSSYDSLRFKIQEEEKKEEAPYKKCTEKCSDTKI